MISYMKYSILAMLGVISCLYALIIDDLICCPVTMIALVIFSYIISKKAINSQEISNNTKIIYYLLSIYVILSPIVQVIWMR